MTSHYGKVMIGTLPKADPPLQACFFCRTRWGWVRLFTRDTYGSHWGIQHELTCEGTPS